MRIALFLLFFVPAFSEASESPCINHCSEGGAYFSAAYKAAASGKTSKSMIFNAAFTEEFKLRFPVNIRSNIVDQAFSLYGQYGEIEASNLKELRSNFEDNCYRACTESGGE